MKRANVKFSAIALYSNGIMSDCRWFASENAMSNWANAQFNKDETVTVIVWVGLTDRVYCTYHAGTLYPEERMETMKKLSKDTIKYINELAKVDLQSAYDLLRSLNIAFDTQYDLLNRRVVFFDDPYASTAEKYAHAHDAYTFAED